MKKLVLVFSIFLGALAYGQNTPKFVITDEQKVEMKVEIMKKELDLTPRQCKRVEKLIRKDNDDVVALGNSDFRLKLILTKEQYKKFRQRHPLEAKDSGKKEFKLRKIEDQKRDMN